MTMFGLLTNFRRRRVLARHSIPEPLWQSVVADVPVLSRLDGAQLARLRDLALLFLHEKRIEPARGLAVTDTMRVRIAVLACLPVLELGLDLYEGFVSVIVYPGEFVVRNRQEVDAAGVVHTADDVLSGEAWDRGPLVLAWSEVDVSGRGTGYNVVAHEFAHKLDGLDGSINGVPPLHRGMRVADWTASFQQAYDELVARLDRGDDTWLDPYAAENPGEFFAVCSEMFFDVPDAFAREYPGLFEQMAAYFRLDLRRR